MGSTPKRVHRTHAEKSAETRVLLLDTAIDCLIERGYAGTTTRDIAERTGLTRGAQFHHFANKEALIAAAVEHLYRRRLEEFERLFEKVRSTSGIKAAFRASIDFNWALFKGRFFAAWLELLVASRTDPKLRALVRDLSNRFADAAEQVRSKYGVEPREEVDLLNEFMFCLMGGRVVLTLPFDTCDLPWVSDAAILKILAECLEYLAANPKILRKGLVVERRSRS